MNEDLAKMEAHLRAGEDLLGKWEADREKRAQTKSIWTITPIPLTEAHAHFVAAQAYALAFEMRGAVGVR